MKINTISWPPQLAMSYLGSGDLEHQNKETLSSGEAALGDLPNTIASFLNIVHTQVYFTLRKNGLPDRLNIATSIDPKI